MIYLALDYYSKKFRVLKEQFFSKKIFLIHLLVWTFFSFGIAQDFEITYSGGSVISTCNGSINQCLTIKNISGATITDINATLEFPSSATISNVVCPLMIYVDNKSLTYNNDVENVKLKKYY